MPKSPQALQVLPPAATQALRALGENLAIARIRRHESQRAWAKRLGVSVPTLIRLERGDPGVGAGIYATALWLMGRVSALPDLAAPGDDRGALESDVREAIQRRAVRSAASTEARLGRGKQHSDQAVAEPPPRPYGSAATTSQPSANRPKANLTEASQAKASQPKASQPKATEPLQGGSTAGRKADK